MESTHAPNQAFAAVFGEQTRVANKFSGLQVPSPVDPPAWQTAKMSNRRGLCSNPMGSYYKEAAEKLSL